MREIKLILQDDAKVNLNKYTVVNEGVDDVSIILNYPHKIVYNIRNKNDIDLLRTNGYAYKLEGEDGYVIAKQTSQEIHVVQPCETLSGIAKKHNITVITLMQCNNLATDKVFIGQKLIIKNTMQK